MVEVKEVADRVYWFEAPIHAVDNVFSVYLIREPEGVVIEPGPAAAVPMIQDAMKELEMTRIAGWMDDVVKNIANEVALDRTAAEVAEFCRSYPPPGLESD